MAANVSVPGAADRSEPAHVASKHHHHHHHHFHGRVCDHFYDVDGCPGGLSAMLPEGFELESHWAHALRSWRCLRVKTGARPGSDVTTVRIAGSCRRCPGSDGSPRKAGRS